MIEGAVRPAPAAGPVAILHGDRTPPAWVDRLDPIRVDAERLAQADARHVLHAAGCVLLDATQPTFVREARRVHALDPAIQVVAVTPPEGMPAARRALLYAPGLGEVWVASPTEIDGALADRAAAITRQRRGFERTRRHVERDRLTISPQRTERALISDAYLASLLRVLPDAVLSVDASGRVLSANAAAHALFAGPTDDLVGRRLDQVLRIVSGPATDVTTLLRLATQDPVEVQFHTARDEVRSGELRAASHHVQQVEVWAVVLRDVTAYHEALEQLHASAAELEAANEELQVTTEELAARTDEAERAVEALRESELSYRALADAIPTLAWTARPDGYIDWYNQRWYEYTGTTFTEVEGSGWAAVHDPARLDEVRERFAHAIATGEPFEMTFPLRGADGRFRTFLTRMVPVTDSSGRIVRWFGTNTDVQAQDEARAAAEEARARADEANRAKSQFLANMSHELRTPLNAIGGYVQLLEMGLHGPVTAPQREALSRIDRAQQHLLGLINDVLNFAKLEGGRVEYHLEPLAVVDVLADVAPLMEPQFAARRLAFTVDVPDDALRDVRVVGDRDKVRQVLLNLLSNAAKFTPAGGSVRLGVHSHDAQTIGMTVTDSGPGIPPDRAESIFEPFVQLRAAYGPSNEGTGLGLAISRDLARGMGGDLWLDPAGTRGSTFIFLLPLAV
ncbi:MAG TPA: PAS domain-containing sensor histidine kinase [Gemmatimonadaceae bacterium]|nr:PAS domain-containing sensor histidine kinase [Gemmatimonadaceae bacterium]